jgi:hypothetical protein
VVRVPGYSSRGPGFDSGLYQIFWEVVGLERGPLSLVSTTAELLGRNSSGTGLEHREYGHGDLLRWPRDVHYPQKLSLTSPTNCGRSVGIVRLRTEVTEFILFLFISSSGSDRCNRRGVISTSRLAAAVALKQIWITWKWQPIRNIINFLLFGGNGQQEERNS